MKAITLFLVMIVIPSLAESDPDLSQGDIIAAIDQRLASAQGSVFQTIEVKTVYLTHGDAQTRAYAARS